MTNYCHVSNQIDRHAEQESDDILEQEYRDREIEELMSEGEPFDPKDFGNFWEAVLDFDEDTQKQVWQQAKEGKMDSLMSAVYKYWEKQAKEQVQKELDGKTTRINIY